MKGSDVVTSAGVRVGRDLRGGLSGSAAWRLDSERSRLQASPVSLLIPLLFLFLLFFVRGAAGQQASARPAPGPVPAGQMFRISGTVVNASTGEVVRRALVSVGRTNNSDELRSMTTGESGGFHFENVAAGKYLLRAKGPGFGEQGFEEHEGFVTAIVTGGAVDSEHLVFRLRPDAAITGTIVDEANEPVRNAQVMLFRRQTQAGGQARGWPAGNAQVNDEGRYRFSHLAPGTYFIAVQATPWYAQSEHAIPEMRVLVDRSGDTGGNEAMANESGPTAGDRALDVTYALTFYPGVTEENAATPVVLKAGDRVTADLRLNPVQALHVRVRTPARDETEPVNAMLMRRVFGGVQMPVQSQNMQARKGEIEVSGIAPGDYELRVENYGRTQERWTQGLALGSDAEVSVNERAPSAVVKGIVKMEGATPIQRGFVRLSNRATGEQASCEVSEKGEFDLSQQRVEPGTYEVIAGNLQNARVSGITATGAKVLGQNVEINGAGAVQLTITLRQGLGTVEGTAMREGMPASGAMVVLVPQDPQNNLPLVRRDQSDLDGTFTLGSVLPGRYTVVAIQDGWDMDWMDMRVLEPFLKNGEKADVGANGKYVVKVVTQ
jgi:hypothetical protein